METRIGLTLGKFAPLHLGHQYLIEKALSQVDRLYVLIYEADETWIPLKRRANWIRRLFPTVEVIEGHGAPQSYGYDEATKREQDTYIRSMMPERITHFFSSEPYGEHCSAALGAQDVRVDMSRVTYPVSATLVRANPVEAHRYLHPVVLRDFIRRVAIIGAESTGKTTLTEALAAHYHTTYMPEHGRPFWIKHNISGKLDGAKLVELALEHRALETRAFAMSTGLFFTDTNAFTTLQFAKLYGEPVPRALQDMADEDMLRYEHYVLCDSDIPFVQDGTRTNEDVRARMQHVTQEALEERGHYWLASGSVEARLGHVRNRLESS